MSDKILLRRGNKADLPVLNVGEPGFSADAKEFYIGAAGGNSVFLSDKRSFVYATQTVIQSIAHNVSTKITFTTKLKDQLTEYDGSGKITVKSAGLYEVAASVSISGGVAAGSELQLSLYKTGAADSTLSHSRPGATGNVGVSGAALIELAANDYIEIYLTQISGVAVNTNNNGIFTYFKSVRVG